MRIKKWLSTRKAEQGSTGTIGAVILGFVGILVIFNLIPDLVTQNATIQANTAASTITKLAGNLGEWLLPLGGIGAIGFGLFKSFKR